MLHLVLTVPAFWVGIVIAPALYLGVLWLASVIYRQSKSAPRWFRGLPIVQYPAFLLLLFSIRLMNRKYCQFKTMENRIWLSPMVDAFTLD